MFLILLRLQIEEEEEGKVAVGSRCDLTESDEQHQEQLQSLKRVFQTTSAVMSCPYACHQQP